MSINRRTSTKAGSAAAGRLRVLLSAAALLAVTGGSLTALAPAAVAADPTAPTAPTAVSARAGVNSAKVYWSAPTDDGGSPVASYTATSIPEGKTCTAAAGATSCTISSLTNGQPYTFTVTATNAAATSAAATTNQVTPANDTTDPVLVSSQVTPDRVSSLSPSTLTVLLHITDDLSGLRVPSGGLDANPAISFVKRGGTYASFGFTRTVTRISGDEFDGIYRAVITVPAGTAPGQWDLSVYPIDDKAGNSTSFLTRPGVLVGAPSAPTNATASASANREVTVTWEAPSDNGGSVITGYQLTDSNTGTTRAVAGLSWTGSFPDIAADKPLTFDVVAVNAAGTSLPTTTASITVPAAAPSPVRNVTALPSNASAAVSWTAPAQTNGAPITGYTITATPGGQTLKVAANATTAIVDKLTNGTAYTFTVVATNAAGTSPPTSAPATPAAAPAAPTDVTAVGGDRSATLTWAEPEGNGATITGYTITASPGGATTTVGDVTTATVTGLTNGTAYTFTVSAANAVGTGTASVATAPVTPAGAPLRPTNVKTVAGDRQARITWSAAEANGSAVTGYTVTANGVRKTLPADARELVLTGLTNGTAYKVTVTATNAVGTSAASAPVTAVPAGKPSKVAKPTIKVSGTTVTIRWKAPAANGSRITAYVITGTRPATKTVGGTITKLVVKNLKPGNYKIRVAARNAKGLGAPSAAVAVRVRR